MTAGGNLSPAQVIGALKPSMAAPHDRNPPGVASFNVSGTVTNLSNTISSIASPSPQSGSQPPKEQAQRLADGAANLYQAQQQRIQ
jgi:hypothetical protein